MQETHHKQDIASASQMSFIQAKAEQQLHDARRQHEREVSELKVPLRSALRNSFHCFWQTHFTCLHFCQIYVHDQIRKTCILFPFWMIPLCLRVAFAIHQSCMGTVSLQAALDLEVQRADKLKKLHDAKELRGQEQQTCLRQVSTWFIHPFSMTE